MSTEALRLLRAAIEHHVDTYGRWGFVPAGPKTDLAPPSPPPVPDVVPVPDQTPLRADHPSTPPEPLPRSVDPASPSPYDRIEALIPADSALKGLTTLEEVAAYVRDTVLIELDETRLNPVFGVGKPDADLMVIGEAPGADEDRQGEPFVGRAGQLLTEILKAIGFGRDDVYIANILKSRPPNNRDPLPDEIAAHVPILYRQISIIRPKILLCVGKTAGNSLLGHQSTLKDLRGHFHDFHGLPVMVTFHPAALLRNSQWKRPTWEDVQQLRRRYDELVGDSNP